MDLKNAVAIVTGSSSGVGAATAKLLASKGCNVLVNYASNQQGAEQTAKACEALGVETVICQGDVSDDAACRAMAVKAMATWGRIDALVNNAGTTKFNAHGNLEGLDKDDFLRLYSVNVVGPYQMLRACEAGLRAAQEASVVNVASIAGVQGIGSSVAYAASKGALLNMTKSLARVMGPQIRVNAVCPGFIQGEWLQEGLGEAGYARALAAMEAKAPLGRVSTAESVAESIVFFIEGNSLVTGEQLILDGGVHLN